MPPHPGRPSFEAPGAMLRNAPLAPQDDGKTASRAGMTGRQFGWKEM
ncbi:hypothetical protein CDS [Bradyrhizobium sp.]|nr:hypothetical protein CDS [Bradyrhizobium sp.]